MKLRRSVVVVALVLLSVAQAAQAKTFAWKATGKGGTIYLVGSIHVMSASFYPLNPALEAAFKDSDLLVEEVDLGEMLDPTAQMSILTKGMLPSNQSLDKVISPATLALVQKALGDSGGAAAPLMRFKPWMLAITLQGMELMKAGFDPSLGLDQHFYDQAKEGGKTVQGLETVEFQISRFDGMTMEQQDRLLAETLKELATETATVGKLGDAWKSGDVATVEQRGTRRSEIGSADVPAVARRAEQELAAQDRGAVRAARTRAGRRRRRPPGRPRRVDRDAQGERLHGRTALSHSSEQRFVCSSRSATTRMRRLPPSLARVS